MGTRIKITTASGIQVNQTNTAVGYGAASDRRVHFGLGDHSVVDEIELTWPSGTVQVLRGVNADQTLTITEPQE
jgi:hypothetical protein